MLKAHSEQGHKIMSADFMRRAIALGLENVRTGGGGPFAALVVKDGRVVAEGANRVTTTNDPTAHAEVVAIREACRRPHAHGAASSRRVPGDFFALEEPGKEDPVLKAGPTLKTYPARALGIAIGCDTLLLLNRQKII